MIGWSALDPVLSSPGPAFRHSGDATFQQSIPHQVEQGLQMFTALDHPARQGLAWDIDTVAAQHFFEAVKR
jgi:hypothetical protein